MARTNASSRRHAAVLSRLNRAHAPLSNARDPTCYDDGSRSRTAIVRSISSYSASSAWRAIGRGGSYAMIGMSPPKRFGVPQGGVRLRRSTKLRNPNL